MIKLSVIIPVYNVGELLYKCIESIQNQSLDNIEIILINDGSTDNSGKICDEIACQNNNIRVIHKENEGVSAARNLGIGVANGEYIGFVDSDDYINENMYLKMYLQAKKNDCDIVMCDTNIEHVDKVSLDTISQLDESKILEASSIHPDLLMEMAGSMCKCIYKKELLINKKVLCPIGIKLSEDRIFNILAFGYSRKIFYIKEPLYIQRIRKNSATTKYYLNMLDIVISSKKALFNALDKSWDNSEYYKKVYEKQNIGSIFQCINNEFHKECKKNIYQKYKGVKYIVSDPNVRDTVDNIDVKNIKVYLIRKKLSIILSAIAFIKYRK